MTSFRLSKKCALLLFCLFLCARINAQIPSNSLDSLKQVLIALNIPEEIQEEWIESLEIYEDQQGSVAFKSAMEEIADDLEDYLVNGKTQQNYNTKKKKKKLFKKIGDRVSAMVAKVTNDIDVSVPLELSLIHI